MRKLDPWRRNNCDDDMALRFRDLQLKITCHHETKVLTNWLIAPSLIWYLFLIDMTSFFSLFCFCKVFKSGEVRLKLYSVLIIILKMFR